MRDFTDVMKMDLEPKGVMVQASTLGALEALMQFLRKECNPPIPVFAVGIGTVFKKDVMRASIMNEKVTSEGGWGGGSFRTRGVVSMASGFVL